MPPLRSLLLVAICLGFVLITVRSLTSRASELPASGIPSAAELDSLAGYLTPVPPAPEFDSYAVFIPATPSTLEPLITGPTPQPAPPPTRLELSAILIAGARPVAVINDEAVGAGTRLEDGSVVVDIQRDHVIVRTPSGNNRRLTLTAG